MPTGLAVGLALRNSRPHLLTASAGSPQNLGSPVSLTATPENSAICNGPNPSKCEGLLAELVGAVASPRLKLTVIG